MAVLIGITTPTGIYTDYPLNTDLGSYPEPNFALVWRQVDGVNGSKISTQPIDENKLLRIGMRSNTFAFLDWYERIHVEPAEFNLGNIVSETQRPISLWNAFFEPHTLNNIVAVGDDGLALTIPHAPPIVFAPLEQIFFTLQIDVNGPAVVDALYSFQFDVGTYDVHVVGVRIVAWAWEVNWLTPVTERLSWLTDIEENYDGSELRV